MVLCSPVNMVRVTQTHFLRKWGMMIRSTVVGVQRTLGGSYPFLGEMSKSMGDQKKPGKDIT